MRRRVRHAEEDKCLEPLQGIWSYACRSDERREREREEEERGRERKRSNEGGERDGHGVMRRKKKKKELKMRVNRCHRSDTVSLTTW